MVDSDTRKPAGSVFYSLPTRCPLGVFLCSLFAPSHLWLVAGDPSCTKALPDAQLQTATPDAPNLQHHQVLQNHKTSQNKWNPKGYMWIPQGIGPTMTLTPNLLVKFAKEYTCTPLDHFSATGARDWWGRVGVDAH